MSNTLNMSLRLKKIATFLPTGTYFADIGSDHAYLPCHVCLNDRTAKAIAGEVNEGPYQSALQTVEAYELASQIDVRLGDGLSVISGDPITEVVIAGMGGPLIKDILAAGEASLNTVRRIVVQPNVAAFVVREWLVAHQFTIIAEEILEENDHIYEIIVAEPTVKADGHTLTPKEIFFGPVLLKEKSAIFIRKWQREKEAYDRILQQVKRAHSPDEKKLAKLKRELQWMKEVLEDEETGEDE